VVGADIQQQVPASDSWSIQAVAGTKHELWWVCGGFVAVGTLLALSNLDLPITRNALCYAKAALGIVQHHFNVLAVAHEVTWTSGKPIFFSFLAAPFVALFNANAGTTIASTVGTAFFLWMVTLALPRLNRRSGINPKLTWLEFVLVAFNPLVFYQFWSAYPDSLFAGLVLLAFILTDVIAAEPERDTHWLIVGLGLTIYLAIHTKLYGAVLGIACPVYLLMHGRQFASRCGHIGSKIAVLIAVFMALTMVLVAAKLGVNPLLELSDGGGYGGYADRDVAGSLSMLAFAVILAFQIALLFLCTRAAWRTWALAPTLFAGIYLVGLMVYSGTTYNMRYFLPVFPFIVPALVAGAESVGPMARRIIIGAYGVTAFMLTVTFNVPQVERLVDQSLSSTYARDERVSYWLDNLRLPVQLALKRQIDVVNAEVPTGIKLYWSSDYYGTATHGMGHHLGIRENINVRYVLYPTQIPAPPDPIFATVFGINDADAKLQQPPEWAAVRTLGYGLFRLDPISVELTSVSGDYVAKGAPVRLHAKIATGERFAVRVNRVEFIERGEILGTAQEKPFDLDWNYPKPGRHEVVARVTYNDGDTVNSKPTAVYVGVPVIERAAHSVAEIAVEAQGGSIAPADDTVELGWNRSTTAIYTGIYFDKLSLDQGAHIASAYLEFTAARPELRPTSLEIQAELSANASSLKIEAHDLSLRRRTVARVRWDPHPWAERDKPEQSPDLVPILREVFAQTGWRPGNSILFLVHGSGRRIAQGPDQEGRGGPRLYIEMQRK
jgi:signal peptidase I